jgi:hypothetical protein
VLIVCDKCSSTNECFRLTVVANRFPFINKLTIDDTLVQMVEKPEAVACPDYKNHVFYKDPINSRYLFDDRRIYNCEYTIAGITRIAQHLRNLKTFIIRTPSIDYRLFSAISLLNAESLLELVLDGIFSFGDSIVTAVHFDFPNLRKLVLRDSTLAAYVTLNAPKLIELDCSANFNLESLDSLQVLTTHYDITKYSHYTTLVHVTLIDGYSSLDSLIQLFKNNPQLESFQIYNLLRDAPIPLENVLDKLKAHSLQHLRISPVDDPILLKYIPIVFPDLKSLWIGGCRKLTDNHVIACLTLCTKIERLEIPFCNGVTDQLLRFIALKHSWIHTLNIHGNNISNSGLTLLYNRCSRLKNLIIKGALTTDLPSVELLRSRNVSVYFNNTADKRKRPKKIQCILCLQNVLVGDLKTHNSLHEEINPQTMHEERVSVTCPIGCDWIEPGTPFSHNHKYLHVLRSQHLQVCPKNIIQCPSCRTEVHYSEWNNHVDTVCSREKWLLLKKE